MKTFKTILPILLIGICTCISLSQDALKPPPIIVIDQPSIDNETVLIKWLIYSNQGNILTSGTLSRYKINNADWSQWEPRTTIALHNLQHGEYLFQVQAKEQNGNYDSLGTKTTFSVLPPFYLKQISLYWVIVIFVLTLAVSGAIVWGKARTYLVLKANEEKFRKLIESTSAAIIIFNDERIILFANEGAVKLTGYKKQELQSMRFDDLIHPDHKLSFNHEELNRRGDSISHHRRELKITGKGNDVVWIDIMYGWLKFESQFATIATAFNITERKQSDNK